MYLAEFMNVFWCINLKSKKRPSGIAILRITIKQNQKKKKRNTCLFPNTKDYKISDTELTAPLTLCVWMETQNEGPDWALPPSVGKLYTLQPFSWPSSLDKVRIVCQRAVMPGMLSAGSPCVCVSVSHTLFCLSSSSLDLW